MLDPRPGETLRGVAGEPALILGGPRALLMQLAHPKIAAAVAEHSDFRRRPWLRLWRTLDAVVLMAFGDEAQVERAVAATRRTHDRVRGRLPEPAGRWRAGAGYTAHDPRAQAWVLCTLADTAEVVFERLVRPLAAPEKERLWEDWRRLGLRFGTPERHLPRTRAGYRRRLEAVLAGDELALTDATLGLAEAVLRPRVPLLPGAVWSPARSLTAGLLPDPLRRAYGLAWGPRQRAEFELWTRSSRVAWGLAPRARRRIPRIYARGRRVLRPGWLEAP